MFNKYNSIFVILAIFISVASGYSEDYNARFEQKVEGILKQIPERFRVDLFTLSRQFKYVSIVAYCSNKSKQSETVMYRVVFSDVKFVNKIKEATLSQPAKEFFNWSRPSIMFYLSNDGKSDSISFCAKCELGFQINQADFIFAINRLTQNYDF